MKIDQGIFKIVQETKEYVNYESRIIFYQNLKLSQNKNESKFIDAFAKIE